MRPSKKKLDPTSHTIPAIRTWVWVASNSSHPRPHWVAAAPPAINRRVAVKAPRIHFAPVPAANRIR